MADTKITALDALTAADPANDVLPIVDVNDPFMAASGTTKKISINNILGASGTATLASATISGNLTVSTSINANGGALALYMNGALLAGTSSGFHNFFSTTNGTRFYNNTGLNELYSFSNAGVFSWFDGAGGTRMTLNSTGLGIGTTVLGGNKLAIGSTSDTSATTNAINIVTNRATITTTCNGAVDAAGTTINYSWANGGQGPLIFRNNLISNVMTLDASGNVGIGVTPSAWNSAVKAMQANVASVANNGPTTWFGSNVFYDSTYTAKYITTSFAGSIIYNPLGFGGWDFNIAASGTTGTAITFSTPMKLDGLGNLILQTPSTPPALATNGQLTVNATSDTNLRFSYRGSDGVTRVANITLA